MFLGCQSKYEVKTTPQSRHKCEIRGPDDIDAIKCPTIRYLLSSYNNVSTDIGKHKKIKAKLIVAESVTPVVHKQ